MKVNFIEAEVYYYFSEWCKEKNKKDLAPSERVSSTKQFKSSSPNSQCWIWQQSDVRVDIPLKNVIVEHKTRKLSS